MDAGVAHIKASEKNLIKMVKNPSFATTGVAGQKGRNSKIMVGGLGSQKLSVISHSESKNTHLNFLNEISRGQYNTNQN